MTGPHTTDASAAPTSPLAPAPAREDALPAFLRFTPVPVKARHDGWSHAVQLRFVLAIARGAGVDEAARSVGRARVGAYRLRRRAGAESFAAAWDAAAAFAAEARGAAHRRAVVGSSIETLLVPRFYRGRLIGYVERENVSGAMGRVAVLDRLAARIDAEGRTDELRALSERLGPILDQRIQR
ncbi:MAG TPA: hypothetical protein VF680_14565 [Allosphingosinicella sp.]|jgi:hypothetical protein